MFLFNEKITRRLLHCSYSNLFSFTPWKRGTIGDGKMFSVSKAFLHKQLAFTVIKLYLRFPVNAYSVFIALRML